MQKHTLFYNASASQRTAELGGNVVDANSSDCPQGLQQCADVSCNPVGWAEGSGESNTWVQALLRGYGWCWDVVATIAAASCGSSHPYDYAHAQLAWGIQMVGVGGAAAAVPDVRGWRVCCTALGTPLYADDAALCVPQPAAAMFVLLHMHSSLKVQLNCADVVCVDGLDGCLGPHLFCRCIAGA